MRSVAINVGANGDTPGGRGPVYSDGAFRFVPITEGDEHGVSEPTYRELGLTDARPKTALDEVTHFDPEFPELDYGEHYTYGDRHSTKTRSLQKLEQGGHLFFFGTLDFADDIPDHYWINSGWGGYIFGHFELAYDPIAVDEYRSLPEEKAERLQNNAHLRRAQLDDDLVFIVGTESGSQLYDAPVPLTLPTPELKGKKKANHFLDREDVTIRSGFWYRGPIELGADATNTLLTAQSDNDYTSLFGPPIDDQPGFNDFAGVLYQPNDFGDLVRILEDHTESRAEECLATFSYIAGGFAPEIPRAIISTEGLGASSITEAANDGQLEEVLTDTVEELRNDEKRWYDGHRKNIATRAGHRRPDGQSLEPYQAGVVGQAIRSCAEVVSPSFYEFLASFQGEDAFATALDRVQSIDTFGRLSAFDVLETFVQANEYEWLEPHRLRYTYVNNVGPKRGIEHVFGVDDADILTQRQRDGMLTQLMAYACDREGFSTPDAVFAVESALCNCQK